MCFDHIISSLSPWFPDVLIIIIFIPYAPQSSFFKYKTYQFFCIHRSREKQTCLRSDFKRYHPKHTELVGTVNSYNAFVMFDSSHEIKFTHLFGHVFSQARCQLYYLCGSYFPVPQCFWLHLYYSAIGNEIKIWQHCIILRPEFKIAMLHAGSTGHKRRSSRSAVATSPAQQEESEISERHGRGSRPPGIIWTLLTVLQAVG